MAFKTFKNIFSKSSSSDSSVSSNGSAISRNDTSSFRFRSKPVSERSENDSSRSHSSNYSQRRAGGAPGYAKNDWYAQKAAWKAHRQAEWESKRQIQAHDAQEIPGCTLNFSNIGAWNAVY